MSQILHSFRNVSYRPECQRVELQWNEAYFVAVACVFSQAGCLFLTTPLPPPPYPPLNIVRLRRMYRPHALSSLFYAELNGEVDSFACNAHIAKADHPCSVFHCSKCLNRPSTARCLPFRYDQQYSGSDGQCK